MSDSLLSKAYGSIAVAASSDSYLHWVDEINVLSVFDDVLYDRSDIDILSPAMRHFAAKFLKHQGYKQINGQCFSSQDRKEKLWMPKPSVLAASPFDIARYVKRSEGDALILTPTQTAALLLDSLKLDKAVEAIVLLIEQQPINLLKLHDHIPEYHQRNAYVEAFPYLRYCQRKVVENPKMRFKRSLGSIF